ncbi:MAG: hypothetical protein A3F42_03950 [Gammaproteobacteria bacterium RIFCSPHIGHO2_12_FULL_37_34]|nr:MAG: hypothetical protein A3F42_03950 [Gammaproteobacteria bacterium RIFCSPHIGHO2_12_FULL_37_34]
MTDIASLITTATTTLHELSKQTEALGVGLQNAAPGNKMGTPNHSIQYLLDISLELTNIAHECEKLIPQHLQHPSIQKKHDA